MNKYFFTLFISLFFLFACEKENKEKTVHDYTGTYVVESFKTKFEYNESWFCGTGLDSLAEYIQDSIHKLEPDFYTDTVYSIDTISIIAKENATNELIVLNMFEKISIHGSDSCKFYIPSNSNELVYLSSNNNWIRYSKDSIKSTIFENEIRFDFRGMKEFYSVSFTYKGTARKLY